MLLSAHKDATDFDLGNLVSMAFLKVVGLVVCTIAELTPG